MNLPVPPPVDLSGLASLPSLDLPHKNDGSLAVPVAAGGGALSLAIVAGLSAWRIVSLGAERRRAASRRNNLLIAAGAGILAAGLVRWQLQRLTNEEPEHEVEQRLGNLEIRRYSPLRIARTTVGGTWDYALNEGFERLAHFIFGGNAAKSKIEMTSPVTSTQDGDGHSVAFMMPKGELPPAPDDARVEIDHLPSRRLAVLRFNGRYNGEHVAAKKRELLTAVAANGLQPVGEPSFAGYDPPSTLPLLRRNEVWVELAN